MRIGRGDSSSGKAASITAAVGLAPAKRRQPTPSTGSAGRPTLWRGGRQMKFESSVTAVSWIPFEAVKGFLAMPFDMGLAHYDEPLPARLENLDDWHKQDLFREANELRGWIEVEHGKITGYGQSGSGRIGVTRLKLGPKSVTVKAKAMPDIRPEPEVTDTYVRFKQTCGGRTGVPAPRPVSRKPFLQIDSAVAWTTLSLTIHSDGRSEYELCGASAFPRHWIYDHSGKLVKETGLTDFATWINDAFGERTPWGAYDSPALVKQVETELERELSQLVISNGKPKRRSLAKGKTLIEQGQPGDDLYLVLDGMFAVEVDGKQVAEIGPGAIVGERAILESGNRTATLRALTPCRVASVPRRYADGKELIDIAAGHRREEAR
ncbi:MAG TPA: hypothetical protein DCF65_04180 [Chloroflexi bacterium]|nr:hypothetical protein [Chloroflexota bacterium]HAF21005.1 hypothetical protein [Chloroflexota bacterium]